MTEFELYGKLDHITYSLQGMVSALEVLRKRIVDEWVNHIPFKTYGSPPVVLSSPLTETQVKQMLAQYSDNLMGDAEALASIANSLRKEETE